MPDLPASPDFLNSVPNLVAGHIDARLRGLRECRGMAGRLDMAAIRRTGIAAPAVLVSRLSARQVTGYSGPHIAFDLSMAAFVVTRDEMGRSRHEIAAGICQALLTLIPDQRWGEDQLGAARDVRDQMLLSEDTAKNGLALWAVTWTQEATFVPLPRGQQIDLRVWLGQAPDIGTGHRDNYQPVGGSS